MHAPIAVDITDRHVNLRTRRHRVENWAAKSRDGEWTFERTEEPGTPWLVTHQPTGFWTLHASLQRAREYAYAEMGLELTFGLIAIWNHVLAYGTVAFDG